MWWVCVCVCSYVCVCDRVCVCVCSYVCACVTGCVFCICLCVCDRVCVLYLLVCVCARERAGGGMSTGYSALINCPWGLWQCWVNSALVSSLSLQYSPLFLRSLFRIDYIFTKRKIRCVCVCVRVCVSMCVCLRKQMHNRDITQACGLLALKKWAGTSPWLTSSSWLMVNGTLG